jgi:acetate kinase
MKILVLNAGSSSWKSSLYNAGSASKEALWTGTIDWTHHAGEGSLSAHGAGGQTEHAIDGRDRHAGIAALLRTMIAGPAKVLDGYAAIEAVGHRVVHGGDLYREPIRIDGAVRAAIGKLAEFAPVHNPAALAGIDAVTAVLPTVPQLAVFDTAFHRTIPPHAATYPIPYAWTEQGIRRYGFHGISVSYCAERAAEMLGSAPDALNAIVAHLGNGCSATAIAGGRSVETTMGFTPLEGLMMGARSGSIDPAVALYLLWRKQRPEELDTPQEVDDALNKASGLLGVSGISSDMRRVREAAAAGNARAVLALEMFAHRIVQAAGSLRTSLRALDALVFTGGIGENDAQLRSDVCASLEHLGVKLDPALNASAHGDHDVATPDSAARVLVIHTEEDWAISRACAGLLAAEAVR